jgi:DNA polymerase I
MFDAFREIVVADFEFEALPGERQVPVCLVARELRSGRRFRLWQDELLRLKAPPYATGRDVLFVAFYASAELGCYRSINWPMPERVLDLYVEFRNHTNGLPTPAGAGLLGALAYCGLDGMGAAEKREMQEAIGKGTWRGRFTPEEILEYCEGGTLTPPAACSSTAPRRLICREACLEAGTLGRPSAPWNGPARRSTQTCSPNCARDGRESRID